MKRQALVALTIFASAITCCGCVTTKTTKGFQTNPPVRTSNGFPHDFSDSQEQGGIKKFFSGMTASNKSKSSAEQPDPLELNGRDPTSLQTPATVSTDLLVVAGEMALKQGRFDLAVDYFQRALTMDPNSQRAMAGLANAKAGRKEVPATEQPNQRNAQLPPNLLGQVNSKSKSKGIQLVSYSEENEIENGPESISVEQMSKPAVENQYAEMTLQPAIEIKASSNAQRVSNPFFGTSQKATTTEKSPPATRKTKKIRPAKVKFVPTGISSPETRSLSD